MPMETRNHHAQRARTQNPRNLLLDPRLQMPIKPTESSPETLQIKRGHIRPPETEMQPEATVIPWDICLKCHNKHHGIKNENITREKWDTACQNRDTWICPSNIKPDHILVEYPTVECPYRVELIMLKDAGYLTPMETC